MSFIPAKLAVDATGAVIAPRQPDAAALQA
jgi:hypothetical protein